jgi:ribosomal protein L40E
VDLLVFFVLVAGVIGFGLLAGAGRSRDDVRFGRRWESSFHEESHREVQTDATGVLMCRRCGAAGSERAGRCPSCGALL